MASLAVLADGDPAWRVSNFGFELFGCRHHLHYPVAKLTDLTDDLHALLENPNPFALVTAAHHLTRHTRRNPESRFEAKRRLVRLLYARNWNRERLSQATPEQLELWAERVLDAPSLDDIFAGN
ncbi:hypothetical protein ACKVEX_05040 [Rhodocyclaceae bacterium SMB388]